MIEIWKDLPLLAGYAVSNLGNVRGNRGLLKPQKNTSGYYQVFPSISGKKHVRYIHRLVVEMYITKDFDYVDHIDGNKINNCASNLRPCNKRQNQNYHIKSKFPGASFDKTNGRWISCISIRGKNVSLGRYDTREEASSAYKDYAKKLNEEIS